MRDGRRLTVLAAAVVLVLTGCANDVAPTRGVLPSTSAATSTSANAEDLTVLGLGDSVVAGAACDCETFVQRYAQIISAQGRVRAQWVNDGLGGQTSDGLLADLTSGATADDVRRADVVLVTVGANDLVPALTAWRSGGCPASCTEAGIPGLRTDVGGIVDRIRELRAGRPVRIGVTDYWNVFEDGAVAEQDFGPDFAAWSDRITDLADTAICTGARQAGATCVDLRTPFLGAGDRDPTRLLAPDGDHPNARGQQMIAQAVADAVRP